jgi:MFS family permease
MGAMMDDERNLTVDKRRQFWVILLIVFIGFVGISMPYLIFPSLFLSKTHSIIADADLSMAPYFLGITLAAYPLGQFIGSPILGALSDQYGRKRLLSSSLLIAALCNLASGLAIDWHHLGLLIVSRFAAGVMEGNIAIARAMAADIKALPKHETFGKINAAASIAFLVGPLLGGLLSDKELLSSLTLATPFYSICVLFFALGGIAEWTLRNASVPQQSEWCDWRERLNLFKRLAMLFVNKRLQFLLLASTFFTLAIDIFYEFGPVYLTVEWGLAPGQLIFYNGALCLALAVGNGWLPRIVASRIAPRLLIIRSTLMLSLCLTGMLFTNSPIAMVLLYVVIGLMIGLLVTTITVSISDAVPDTIQGEVMGLQLSLRVLGDALICAVGGALLAVSAGLILLVAVAISLLAMGYYVQRAEQPA